MQTTDAEVIEITLENKIESELVKHNVTESVLAALKNKYGGMKLRAIDDKESYLELKDAAKDCSKLRNLTVKVCKAGREDAVKIQKLWVAKEKEVVGKIEEVEGQLDAEIKKYDDEVDRKKNEEKRKQEEAYMHRTQALTKIGAVYANEEFSLGSFSIAANLVKETSLDVWENEMLPAFINEYEIIESERIKQDQIKAEREAEIRRQQEEIERQQAELKAQQEAFRKQQEDAARIEREKRETEEKEKREEAQRLQKERFELMYPYNPTGAGMDMATLWVLAEGDFQEKLAAKKIEFKKQQEEKQKSIEEAAAAREREKIAEEQRIAEIKRQQEEQRKAEELANAGDKVQWDNFISELSKIVVPDAKSGQYRKIAAIAKENIGAVLNLKAYKTW